MKKLVILGSGLIVVVLLYCGATLLSAFLFQQRCNQMHASAMNQYKAIADQYKDMIKVISHKVDHHFFWASDDITFEVNHPLLKTLLKNGAEEEQNNQFTIHNDIAFGPFPNFRSVGLAHIETSLVLTDEQRKSLIEAVGTDKPLRFLTTMYYFGIPRVAIISSPLEFHSANKDESGTWKGGKVLFSFSGDLGITSINGNAPGLVVNSKDNSVLRLDNLTLSGELQRKFEVLFTGNETFSIGNISFSEPSKPDSAFSMQTLTYGIRSTADDQFINFGVAADSAAVTYKNVNLKEAHFDFGTNHLDAKTLVSLYKTIQDIQVSMLKQHDNASAGTTLQTEDIKSKTGKDILTIFQHAPVLQLDNIGFATVDGSLKITGNATINDVTEEDILPEVQYQSLAKKVHAQSDISIDQTLIDHWPVAEKTEQIKQQISALISQGFITRNGNKLESHIEYKDGKITANGEQVGG